MRIWLDMDGTIADLYAVENWLPMLQAHNPTPYEQAKPLVSGITFFAIVPHSVRVKSLLRVRVLPS